LNTTKGLYSLYARTKDKQLHKRYLFFFVDMYSILIYSIRVVKRTTFTHTKEGKAMIKISFIDSKGIKHSREYTSKEIYNMRLQLCLDTLEELGFYSIGESIEYGLTTEEDFEGYENDLHTCRKNNTLEEFSTYEYRRALRTLKHIKTILDEGY
jgi:hypothetical protein